MIAVQYSESGTDFICCHGPGSVYSFFAALLPHCARDAKGEVSANPEGVSRIEMNKMLVNSGYQVFRKRELAPGSKDLLKRGYRRWKYRRWTNPGARSELEEIDAKLRVLQSEFPETSSLSLEEICQQLSLFRAGSPGLDLQCESTDEEESPEQPWETVSGPHLKLMHPHSDRSDANHSGFKCFEASDQDPELSARSHRRQALLGPIVSTHDEAAPETFLHETFFATVLQLFAISEDNDAARATAGRPVPILPSKQFEIIHASDAPPPLQAKARSTSFCTSCGWARTPPPPWTSMPATPPSSLPPAPPSPPRVPIRASASAGRAFSRPASLSSPSRGRSCVSDGASASSTQQRGAGPKTATARAGPGPSCTGSTR